MIGISRFARLASAGALLAQGDIDADWQADLVHANDWPSALLPAYLSWNGAKIPTVLTIHNLAFQVFFRDRLYSASVRVKAPTISTA